MSAAIRITGATRLYAIIGDPIAQVRSPETFSARFADGGIDAVLVPWHVPDERFDAIVPALLSLANLDGVLVTVPFKVRMAAFASRLGAGAECIGAVNALRREADGSWTGDMFDGIGFICGAERKGERIAGRRAALFGAGGAGSAIACALAGAGAASIDIIDVDRQKAEALVRRLKSAFAGCEVATATDVRGGIDLVVNASPVGMQPGDGLPGAIPSLEAGTLVGDVVITEAPTPIIRHAMRCGCRWVDGRDMHGGQADAIMSFFSASRAAG